MTTTKTPTLQGQPQTSLPRMIVRFVLFLLLGPILLFLAAGDVAWAAAWIAVGLMIAGTVASRFVTFLIHPDLLRERGSSFDRMDVAPFDRILAPLIGAFGPFVIWLIAGLDHRFGWSPAFAPWLLWLGGALIVVSFAVGSWALAANRFFSGVVRIQTDRGHEVVSSGPYAIVRHPGYASALPFYGGIVLLLGSLWAILPAAGLLVALMIRTALEDRFLQQNLPGYADYAQRVCYRLIPGLW